MPYYASTLVVRCDYKRCRQTLTVPADDGGTSFSMLVTKATEKGWWLDPGSSKCMCPTCTKVSQMAYEKKLDKEKERVKL
jgi:hypothetical protein